MRGNGPETAPFQPYFGCSRYFLKVVSSQRLQATRPVRAEQIVNLEGPMRNPDIIAFLQPTPTRKRFPHFLFQKNPRVRKIFVRNSGAGNGCANFMDAWKNSSVLQKKPCP